MASVANVLGQALEGLLVKSTRHLAQREILLLRTIHHTTQTHRTTTNMGSVITPRRIILDNQLPMGMEPPRPLVSHSKLVSRSLDIRVL